MVHLRKTKNINASSLSNLNALLYGCHSNANGQKKNTLYSPLTLYADENRPAKNSGVMQCHEQIIAVTRENASLHALELKGEGSVKSNNIRDKKRT